MNRRGKLDYSNIRGFNYQPSYASSGLEVWQLFDAETVRIELGRGKGYFPGMNAIRLWLSWDAFNRSPERFADSFETSLAIAGSYGLVVMPVLFNRWHSCTMDYGGIYIDHFLPKANWIQTPGMFDRYMETIVGGHAKDPRIFAWDLCNEPFSYNCPSDELPEIARAELAWLEGLYQKCKELGSQAPITVGIHGGEQRKGIARVESICDFLSIHPYYDPNAPGVSPQTLRDILDEYVDFAADVGKPLLATEACWGSLDDDQRAEIVRVTLSELKARGIGWLAYALHHSLVPDLHRPEFGPVGGPGYLGFIEADGSLRKGHEVFNEF